MLKKRKGSSGLILISCIMLVALTIGVLSVFAFSIFSSSTIYALARGQTHIILSEEKVPGSGSNDQYCSSFFSMLLNNGIIDSASDIQGSCSWQVYVDGTLPDGSEKLVATLQIPPILVDEEVIYFDPVSAFRE